MSLALGWRNASDLLPIIPQDIGNLMLGLSTGFFLWFLVFYARKLVGRPMVLFEDMRTAPARAGIAAMAMSMMLLAAALLPLNVSVPQVWWTGVVMQIGASAIVLHAIWKDHPGKRHFSTFQYLTFVGPVVGPIAGIPLGHVSESYWLTMAALVAFVIVTAGIALTFSSKAYAGPLRPSMMIFLAPVSLFALSYGGLGYDWAFAVFYGLGNVITLVLLVLAPWMARGGYTPVWASFTFPLAAFINVHVMAISKGYGVLAIVGVYTGLALGTPLIIWIAFRSIMAWVTGELAQKSGAAIA